jgi:hypothetical protein
VWLGFASPSVVITGSVSAYRTRQYRRAFVFLCDPVKQNLQRFSDRFRLYAFGHKRLEA